MGGQSADLEELTGPDKKANAPPAMCLPAPLMGRSSRVPFYNGGS
jgi:hypothetical protein